MKRTLTGIAAASMVLGTMAPMALAATTSSTKWQYRTFEVNNQIIATQVPGFVSNGTLYTSLYNVQKVLNKLGLTNSWNVNNLSITTTGTVDTSKIPTVPGNAYVWVNGTKVMTFSHIVAKDNSGVTTSFLPVYDIQVLLNALGYTNAYDGAVGYWNVSAPANTAGAALSALSVTGEAVGTGTATSPAVALTYGNLTFNSTLTNDGVAVSGVDLTYTITTPAATTFTYTANGSTSTVTTAGSGTDYTATIPVSTGANGTAPLVLSSASGTSATVSVSAPYASVTAPAAVYVAWANPGSAVMSPTSDTVQFSSTSDTSLGVVPITVTVLPAYSGQSVSGISVSFTETLGSSGVQFTNSAGNVGLSTGVTVITNASGQAVAYINDIGSFAGIQQAGAMGSAVVTATVPGTSVSPISGSTINWAYPGEVAAVSLNQTTPITATAGTDQTISGQVTDVLGNPVSGVTVDLSGDATASETNSFVVGSNTTSFTGVGTNKTQDTAVTNANGDFTFTVTDSTGGDSDHYAIAYTSPNGIVQDFSGIQGDLQIVWAAPTGITAIGIGTTSGATASSVSSFSPAGTSQTFYVTPLNAQGNPVTVPAGQEITMTVTANHGDITNWSRMGSGQASGTTESLVIQGGTSGAWFTVTDATTETDTYTVSYGTAKATATEAWGGNGTASVTTSAGGTLTLGQSYTETVTALNSNNQPVANQLVTLTAPTGTSAYVTAINGTSVTYTPTSGTAEPAAISLYSGATVTAMTNANGVATFTIGDGSLSGAIPLLSAQYNGQSVTGTISNDDVAGTYTFNVTAGSATGSTMVGWNEQAATSAMLTSYTSGTSSLEAVAVNFADDVMYTGATSGVAASGLTGAYVTITVGSQTYYGVPTAASGPASSVTFDLYTVSGTAWHAVTSGTVASGATVTLNNLPLNTDTATLS